MAELYCSAVLWWKWNICDRENKQNISPKHDNIIANQRRNPIKITMKSVQDTIVNFAGNIDSIQYKMP